MTNPLAYPLCCQTVTVYTATAGAVQRQVWDDCFYRYEDTLEDSELGKRLERKFLLIRPGQAQIRPGDRVYDGVGPENPDWDSFLPVNVPGLSQVAYVTAHKWQGQVCHIEAGRK